MGNVNAKDPDYWNVTEDPRIRNENWMGRLPRTKLLSDISIPGTHNTMARATDLVWVWCQSLSLGTQMNIGIRFFDIRCRHYKNGLPIHHGLYYQECCFEDCIKEMVQFLQSHGSEILLVRVKEEKENYRDGPDCTRLFHESVQAIVQHFPQNKFWLDERIPNVEEARGKIVMLTNFTCEKPLGIPYYKLQVEDSWEENDCDAKWNKVKTNLEEAERGSKSNMYLTFNTAAAWKNAPREMARRMNPRLHSYVTPRRGRFGIIAIDYPGPKLVQDIIETNF